MIASAADHSTQAKITIIPARRGSKPVLYNNICDFRGKLIIACSIGAELKHARITQ